MPKRDPKTGRFMKSAATGNKAVAGSRTGKGRGGDVDTGKSAERIPNVRRRVGGRVRVQARSTTG